MIARLLVTAAVASTAFAATAGFSGEAHAAPVCKDRDAVVETLAKRYQETRRGYGLSSQMQVLELYASEKGTWTAVVTTPEGKSCVVASGEAWTEPEAVAVGQPVSLDH